MCLKYFSIIFFRCFLWCMHMLKTQQFKARGRFIIIVSTNYDGRGFSSRLGKGKSALAVM